MFNRLKGQIAYLSGPIDKAEDHGEVWRERISQVLQEKYKAKVYNPLKKPFKEANENDWRFNRWHWKENGEYKRLAEVMKEVRHYDLRLVDKADFGIFYINTDIIMCGTLEELFTMNWQHKPCLVVCEQTRKGLMDWVFGAINTQFLFDNFSDMFEYLDYVNSSKDFDNKGRWVFFKE